MNRYSSERTSPLAGFEIKKLDSAGTCVFSVDVEDWFHSNFTSLREFDTSTLPRRVEEGVTSLLEELEQAGARATFFVLGVVAEQHPGLVPQIAAAGHEIGCHSYRHTLLYEQSPDELHEDLTRARGILREQSGQDVLGFRAPSWSITEKSLWALDVIAEVGFRYDSSIFPFRNYLYGLDGVPSTPYELRTPAGARLTEVPPSTIGLGSKRIGVGGGVYLRVLPLSLQRYALRKAVASGNPFMIYVHPREFDAPAWRHRLPLSASEQAIHSFGLERGRERLRTLLKEQRWHSIATLLAGRG